jgi:hypothetical protein
MLADLTLVAGVPPALSPHSQPTRLPPQSRPFAIIPVTFQGTGEHGQGIDVTLKKKRAALARSAAAAARELSRIGPV